MKYYENNNKDALKILKLNDKKNKIIQNI